MIDHESFLERALLDSDRLSSDEIARAREQAKHSGCDLSEAIATLGLMSERQLAMVRADIAETSFVDIEQYQPQLSNAAMLPRTLAEQRLVFPLFKLGDVLTLAMHDPLDIDAMDRVRQAARCEIDAVLCEREPLREIIARAYSLTDGGDEFVNVESDDAGDHYDEAAGPVVAAVRQILADAAEDAASDVHINPDEYELHVRFRVDGVLQQRQGPSKRLQAGVIQRLKVLASLDLTQTRRPQDGKFRFSHEGNAIDVRVSVIPTLHGENVVLRLQHRQSNIGDFTDLGMPSRMISTIRQALAAPYGMLLVTGPTGSGKTTTLYTAIKALNDPSRNIMTIEDPVEIRMPYVRQVQVQADIGLTFASALRSILRQDPDVVLVGEIRDDETARIACQAALTGHLVLSTLHTNDAPAAVTRLRDFGVPSFVINSALIAAIAQRLVRRLDHKVAVPDIVDEATRRRFRLDEDRVRRARFMRAPEDGAGYRGRVGIYEVVEATPSVREVIDAGGTTDQVRRAAIEEGFRPMWLDGLEKASVGLTSLNEILRSAPIIDVETPLRKAAA
ncbi:MAG: GspE/PulE family protein [Planctomycetota bacterium]